MAVRRNYRINLRNYGNPPAIMVSQYDENYDLVFEVYDGVVPATGLNAYTVKLVGRQPGNDPALKYEFTGTVSGIANNILSFTIDTTMTGRAGKGTAEIVILDTTNDVKFASFNLPVYVEKAAVPDDAIDADVERAQEIADEVQDIVDTAAAEVKGEAESWAVGERDGEPVSSTDPTYHNNAKYYAERAQDIADSIGIDATLSISGKAADAKKTGDEISGLKEDLQTVVCHNIMGNDANVLYPVDIPQGGYFTVSTNDGSIFATDSTLQVQLLDATKVQRDYFGLKNGESSRTIHTSTSAPATKYLRFNATPDVPLMVNYGKEALPYEAYFPNLKDEALRHNTQIVEIESDVSDLQNANTITDIGLKQGFVKVSRPRIINGCLSTSTGKRDYTLSYVNSYCITPELLHVAKGSKITKSSATTMRIYEYDANDNFVSYSTVSTGTTSYTFASDKYVRLFFSISGVTRMSAKAVIDSVVFNLVLYNYHEPSIITTFMGLNGESDNHNYSMNSGEACLIQFPDSTVMAIDFHADTESNNLQAYRDALALRGVRRLDYIVITHYHDDHMGLLIKSINNGYIYVDGATVYLPQLITDELATARGWETYKERQDTIIETLEELGCTIVHPVDGDVLKIGESIIEWYNCDHSVYSDSEGDYYSTNYNDWSLCFNFRYYNTVINYTGDLGPVGQRAMGGKMPKATILKAQHHGWDNGVNNLIPAFINNVNPDMVVVCNGYAHRPTAGNEQASNMLNPSSPLYSWGEANGVSIYPTITNGNINILVDKYGYRLDGHYTKFIRNDKNWSYTDNSEHIES